MRVIKRNARCFRLVTSLSSSFSPLSYMDRAQNRKALCPIHFLLRRQRKLCRRKPKKQPRFCRKAAERRTSRPRRARESRDGIGSGGRIAEDLLRDFHVRIGVFAVIVGADLFCVIGIEDRAAHHDLAGGAAH